jgi:hypothetical protein
MSLLKSLSNPHMYIGVRGRSVHCPADCGASGRLPHGGRVDLPGRAAMARAGCRRPLHRLRRAGPAEVAAAPGGRRSKDDVGTAGARGERALPGGVAGGHQRSADIGRLLGQ